MERKQEKIRCVTALDAEYPEKLKDYGDMPGCLYVRGNLPAPDLPSVAVVGARMCSPYGRIQAFRYARVLSEAGVQIISGLAWGIDSEGHKGALEGGTSTFAVLGNGVDICYPAGNRELYQRILRGAAESAANILPEPGRGNIISPPETGLSVDLRISC